MNERIKELYKEATGKDWAYDFDPQVAEKFAQLIVRECLENALYGNEFEQARDNVKLCFGVEE